jgi:hypothetical protein
MAHHRILVIEDARDLPQPMRLDSQPADSARPGGRSARMKMILTAVMSVRPEGANHQWRKNPPGELSIDPVADERLAATAGVGAS